MRCAHCGGRIGSDDADGWIHVEADGFPVGKMCPQPPPTFAEPDGTHGWA